LASLLWRSRREILIESGLSAIQAEIVRDRRRRNGRTGAARLEPVSALINGATDSSRGNGSDNLAHTAVEQYRRDCPDTLLEKPIDCARLLTHTFLRLANLESGAFGLLNRYGLALWRQTVQTIIALRAGRRRW